MLRVHTQFHGVQPGVHVQNEVHLEGFALAMESAYWNR
jgi:hypothetical protein